MKEQSELHALREQGFRLTHQRRLILDYIKQRAGHVTADDIYSEVSRHCPEMNIATVYRNLQWLYSVGLLRKFDLGKDRLEYEYASADAHHHLICKDCGSEQEIDDHVMVCFRAHVLEHYGFEADPEHVPILGRCAQCRAKDNGTFLLQANPT
jgi:Fur family transcriptional regulator, ferric uptake regulator